MRLKFIRLIYIAVVLLIVLRLAFWQIVRADDLTAKAEDQRTLTQDIIAPRGDILFSDGSTLATSQPSYLLYAQPKVIGQKFVNGSQSDSSNQTIINSYKQTFAQQLTQELTS